MIALHTQGLQTLTQISARWLRWMRCTTRNLCERVFKVHGEARFELLVSISNGHLYNLRQHETYQAKRRSFDKTHPVKINIGLRCKPHPDGQPDHLRVDSVHQGDLDGIKGVQPDRRNRQNRSAEKCSMRIQLRIVPHERQVSGS